MLASTWMSLQLQPEVRNSLHERTAPPSVNLEEAFHRYTLPDDIARARSLAILLAATSLGWIYYDYFMLGLAGVWLHAILRLAAVFGAIGFIFALRRIK